MKKLALLVLLFAVKGIVAQSYIDSYTQAEMIKDTLIFVVDYDTTVGGQEKRYSRKVYWQDLKSNVISAVGGVDSTWITTDTDTGRVNEALYVISSGDTIFVVTASTKQMYTAGASLVFGLVAAGSNGAATLKLENDAQDWRVQVNGSDQFVIKDNVTGNVVQIDATAPASSIRLYSTGGLAFGSPTGGDQGAGTLNTKGLYVEGEPLIINPPKTWDAIAWFPPADSGAVVDTLGNKLEVLNFYHNTDSTTAILSWHITETSFTSLDSVQIWILTPNGAGDSTSFGINYRAVTIDEPYNVALTEAGRDTIDLGVTANVYKKLVITGFSGLAVGDVVDFELFMDNTISDQVQAAVPFRSSVFYWH